MYMYLYMYMYMYVHMYMYMICVYVIPYRPFLLSLLIPFILDMYPQGACVCQEGPRWRTQVRIVLYTYTYCINPYPAVYKAVY
jgi:hypothetical protein